MDTLNKEWYSLHALSKLSGVPYSTAGRYTDKYRGWLEYREVDGMIEYSERCIEVLQFIYSLHKQKKSKRYIYESLEDRYGPPVITQDIEDDSQLERYYNKEPDLRTVLQKLQHMAEYYNDLLETNAKVIHALQTEVTETNKKLDQALNEIQMLKKQQENNGEQLVNEVKEINQTLDKVNQWFTVTAEELKKQKIPFWKKVFQKLRRE